MNGKYIASAAMAALCLVPGTAFAAAEPGQEGILPPIMRDVMIVLCLVLGVLLLFAVAFLWAVQQQARPQLAKVDHLAADMKAVTAELRALQSMILPEKPEEEEEELPPAPAPEEKNAPAPVSRSIWKAFVDDFNSLARSMEVPKKDVACENFVAIHKLVLLKCRPHKEGEALDFALEKSIGESEYWAWPIPGENDRYAVVPKPILAYDDKLHREGGMKETFASNFESGDPKTYHQVEVKLPAIFRNKDGKWQIEQPGLMRLAE